MKEQETVLLHISKLLICYLAVLVVNGYVFGGEQMGALSTYAKFLSDGSLYGQDFYIDYLNRTFPNEHVTLAWLLAQFNVSAFWAWLLHLGISLFLFAGIYKIGYFLIRNIWMPYLLIILLCMPPLYGIGLSADELYLHFLSSKMVAHACLVWVLYFWLVRNSINYVIFLSLGIFFHVAAGAQIWFLTVLGEIIFHFFRRRRALLNLKRWLIPHLIVTFLAGLWVFLYVRQYTDTEGLMNQFLDFLRFNSPAPFYVERATNLYYYYLFGIFYIIAAYTFRFNLKFLILIAINGLGLAVFVYFMTAHSSQPLITSQWFRSTIWIELFAICALLRWLSTIINITILKRYETLFRNIVSILVVIVAGFIAKPQVLFQHNPYILPWKDVLQLAEIDIAYKTRILTDKEPLVVIPPNFTYFRFYSERSVLVSFLTPISQQEPLQRWIERMRDVYSLETDQSHTYINSVLYAMDTYKGISDAKIAQLKQKYCITHIILNKNTPTIHRTVIANDFYKLVEL